MRTGHASHQVGLDADIWLTPMPDRQLTRVEREEMSATMIVREDRLDVDPQVWTPAHVNLIKAAAKDSQVNRIFVNAAIKKALCRDAGSDRHWLGKAQPWWGHDFHFHVRLNCPSGSPECSPQPPRPADVPERYLLFVGKLEPGKAPDRLHPILDAARAEIPLLVAGSGSLEPELKARGGNVRFLGWVDDERALALIKHADCLLFPSRWQEPLSRVLLDAIALGAVIVAEPTGGTGEIVIEGESGLLGRSEAELGGAVRRVLDDPVLARRLREGARLRARALFSEEVVLPGIESLYRSVSGR